VKPGPWSCAFLLASLLVRIGTALDLQTRLTQHLTHFAYWWLVPVKDLLQAMIWVLAFLGNRIEWRGQRLRLRRDGTLAPIGAPQSLPQGGSKAKTAPP
jgi:ceramide glucosyltransferase